MLLDLLDNFRHNLFKPLLLFFYMGFLIPVLRVKFELPYSIYQALTLYLLLAIGWHGGEQLAMIAPGNIIKVLGFMVLGFLTNTLNGFLAYRLLKWLTNLRRIDLATVAGYYGSDSAGTFATCIGVLTTLAIPYSGYLPVMLAVMEMPGCFVALFLVARLREQGMDRYGYLPGERGYHPNELADASSNRYVEDPAVVQETITGEHEEGLLALEEPPARDEALVARQHQAAQGRPDSAGVIREILLNPGIFILFGGVTIGLLGGLQGEKAVHDDNIFYITAFHGVLSLFLLEMGMTAARHIADLKAAGKGFIFFGLLAPNLFAILGMTIARLYDGLAGIHFQHGDYILFAVLCAAASYVAVPAVQRMAIPEASPTLPLAASLGLTFAYNVTIGIPIYIEIARYITLHFPVS